ncbi:MAG TPA: universal stress protein [Sphingomicrobium sp.]|nr:universal stress protein [Sphingomicrobium sp.]
MYRNILVPVDLDQPASWAEAISTASSLAKCFSAKITVCSVVSDVEAIKHGEWLPISVEQLMFDARARLEGLAAATNDDVSYGVEVAAGTIAGGILEITERIAADLIVLVSHQPAPRDYLLAANAVRVARRAPCSVLIARHGGA